ncbi:hypothetical protein VTO42DRAFT_7456 [Malbranchea cinnamomea]
MGRESNHRQTRKSKQITTPGRSISMALLAIHYSTSILLLHYTRVSPVVGGRRYIPSTAVFLTEVIKLALCMTIALYNISRSAPPSMPATSLFSSLSSAIFSGDSWKLAAPAALYTIANSLQYVGLSNLEVATFQVTYQLRLVVAAAFGAVVFKKNLIFAKWASLLAILIGAAIVQLPAPDPYNLENRSRVRVSRSLEEWKNGIHENTLHKRSATYEGLEEDLMIGHPRMNGNIGLLATALASIASGLASVFYEKVLKDGSNSTTVWIRNVQLAIYSIFPALFIGVVFLDGEEVAKSGFFKGYSRTVWTTIGAHAIGGIATSFCIIYAENALRYAAGGISVALTTIASLWLFEFQICANFIIGTTLVLAAIYVYIQDSLKPGTRPRPASIRIRRAEKADVSPDIDSTSDVVSPPSDFSIRLPTTPLISEALSTSRPGSPRLHRDGQGRSSYSGSHHRET